MVKKKHVKLEFYSMLRSNRYPCTIETEGLRNGKTITTEVKLRACVTWRSSFMQHNVFTNTKYSWTDSARSKFMGTLPSLISMHIKFHKSSLLKVINFSVLRQLKSRGRMGPTNRSLSLPRATRGTGHFSWKYLQAWRWQPAGILRCIFILAVVRTWYPQASL
jgi:hypothetical protein